MKLLWGDRTRPPRGRPPTLTLDQIVAAAVEVADELSRTEGIEALSMRAIATHLGVGTMSLYRYVPGRSELLDLMLDHVIDVPDDEPDDERGWRGILADEAREHWRLCMDHPWYPFVDQSQPLLGPNSMRGLDRLFRRLRPSGIDDRTLMMMFIVQNDFVEGIARSHLNERRAERRTGMSNEEFWQTQIPTLVDALESGDFPTMADLADDTFDSAYDEIFEFGLNRLHDGFAAFIAGRAG
ncbi:TetR/AcrR family transcriptional regulator [Actinomadura sp. KC345]|nr:TetR/AcrR family transcriptional regulator [Actinomadura sp. KC345]